MSFWNFNLRFNSSTRSMLLANLMILSVSLREFAMDRHSWQHPMLPSTMA